MVADLRLLINLRPQIEHIMWVVERSDYRCGDDLVGVVVALIQLCQNGACDLDIENEVIVQRSRNFNWHRSVSFGTNQHQLV